MTRRERFILTLGAAVVILAAAAIGGVVYGLLKASIIALRWWAVLATLAAIVGPILAWRLGIREARARLDGIDQGIERVARAAARTVDTARQAAEAAQRMQRPQPAVQQVILPGLPAGSPVILPADQGGEIEV